MKKRIDLMRQFSIPLIFGVAIALFWANRSPHAYQEFLHRPFLGPLSFHFLTNDVFMVFFFGIAAVEITQSCLPGGDLNPLHKAMNPLMATAGGVMGPAIVYAILNTIIGSHTLSRGWGIPTATDIAFAWLVARMVFGSRHPAISFLLLLAVVDDGIGLAIIAIFYPNPHFPVAPVWLSLTAAGMAIAYLLRRTKIKSYWPYLILGGSLSWSGLYFANLHPALALVFIVPFMPHAAREKSHVFEEDTADFSTISRFEHEWKILVDFGLFMFGLANAGVPLTEVGTATWIVFLALLIGKSSGIFSMALIAERLGFPLPKGMHRKELLVSGIIGGFGFTVALFVAGEAFIDPVLQGAAKMGAILSCSVAIIAPVVARSIGVRRRER